MIKSSAFLLSSLLFCIMLSGCGTVAPSLAEYGSEGILVRAIVQSIKCEIATAVRHVIDKDVDGNSNVIGPVGREFRDHWGAEVAITLIMEDKTTISPNAVGMPPSPASFMFAIGGSLSGSSQAIRTDKVNFFFTLKDLYNQPCTAGLQPRAQDSSPSIIIQNDLKTEAWLFDQLLPIYTGAAPLQTSAKGKFQQNVFSHEIKFVINSTGSLTPSFVLSRASINQSGQFLTASRDRTSDLVVTFGPLDKDQKNGTLIPQAEYFHQASQFGLAVSTSNRPSSINFSLLP